jgi:signal transduction histidine kinase/CheY-like chemotaxis protein
MGLKTVRVPPEMESPFSAAEEIVSRFFGQSRSDPTRGTIEIFGERYVLVRAASMSVEFFTLVHDLYGRGREQEADDFARNILFDLAHAIGKSDAHDFHAKMDLRDPIARLSAGPVHFAYTGWAFVDIFGESVATPDDTFCLVYDHPYSFESDAWLRSGRKRESPACIMNAGYSSGWCEESFGIQLVSTEILCRAKGDETCRFIMSTPGNIEEKVARYLRERPAVAQRAKSLQVPDFFARKRIEEELRRSRAELEVRVEERTRELREANEKLMREMADRAQAEERLRQASKLEAIGRLAGGVAHDFNNLLGVILTRASVVERSLEKDHPASAGLGQIIATAERAATLARQLLAFGRPQMSRRDRVDLNAALASLEKTLIPLVGEQVRLSTTFGQGLGAIEVDRGQLDQVIMNLVVNARDAMPGGGTLSLQTSSATLAEPLATTTGTLQPGPYVVLSVEDTGSGMDGETVSRIFDPFFSTKPESVASGLGLSIVYGVVVQQARGAIQVTTGPDRGTRFDLFFPRAKAPVSVRAPSGPQTVLRGTETILLVEDQRDLREAIRDALEDCGYRVISVGTPEEALEFVRRRERPLHLVLSDVIMPGMSGQELVRRIARDIPGIKVLFVSGYAPADAGDVEQAFLLPKPFTQASLSRKLREVLDG